MSRLNINIFLFLLGKWKKGRSWWPLLTASQNFYVVCTTSKKRLSFTPSFLGFVIWVVMPRQVGFMFLSGRSFYTHDYHESPLFSSLSCPVFFFFFLFFTRLLFSKKPLKHAAWSFSSPFLKWPSGFYKSRLEFLTGTKLL